MSKGSTWKFGHLEPDSFSISACLLCSVYTWLWQGPSDTTVTKENKRTCFRIKSKIVFLWIMKQNSSRVSPLFVPNTFHWVEVSTVALKDRQLFTWSKVRYDSKFTKISLVLKHKSWTECKASRQTIFLIQFKLFPIILRPKAACSRTHGPGLLETCQSWVTDLSMHLPCNLQTSMRFRHKFGLLSGLFVRTPWVSMGLHGANYFLVK